MATHRGQDENIKNYKPEALNKILEEFYTRVCKQEREEVQTQQPQVVVTATDRHLKEVKFKNSVNYCMHIITRRISNILLVK